MPIGEPYEAFDDPYCYKGTSVLKNRARLRDGIALEGFELEMTAIRAEESLPEGILDPAHYRAVHRHLFQDVYGWAGKYRTVRTAKDGNSFCFPEHIPEQMEHLFNWLGDHTLESPLTRNEFVSNAAHFLGELNAIHAFREGNGRTQLAFLHLIGAAAGWPMDLSKIEALPMFEAMIESFYGKLDLLESEIDRLLI